MNSLNCHGKVKEFYQISENAADRRDFALFIVVLCYCAADERWCCFRVDPPSGPPSERWHH